MNELGQHEREATSTLAGIERKILPKMARSLPEWVMPDHMTVVGIIAATMSGAAYVASSANPAWLWVATFGIALNWFGDSLDGTLARVRRTERPRYGFYLDHFTDAYSTIVIGLGLGLSPFMLLSVALTIVIIYLVLSINVYLETHVFKTFNYTYGAVGPTEGRLILIGLNTVAVLFGPIPFLVFDLQTTIYDVFGVAVVVMAVVMLLTRVTGNLRTLGRLEPPGQRREE